MEQDTQTQAIEGQKSADQLQAEGDAQLIALVSGKSLDKPVEVSTDVVQSEDAQPVKEESQNETPSKTDQGNVPAQFKKADGSLDEEKIQKSTEHLQKMVQDKAQALEAYKELQRKNSKIDSALKKAKEEKLFEFTGSRSIKASNFDEWKAKFSEALADPNRATEALIEMAETISDMKVSKLEEEKAREKAAARERHVMERLDSHTNSNPWMLTEEGRGKVNRVLEEKPFLWESNDPFGDALRFVEDRPQVPASANAPAAKSTPILGSGRAVPAPSASKSVSLEQRMADLGRQIQDNVRNKALVKKLNEELDKVTLEYMRANGISG